MGTLGLAGYGTAVGAGGTGGLQRRTGSVSGEVVYIVLQQAGDIDKYAGKLKGKIVLLGAMRPTPDITNPLFSRYSDADLKDMESSPLPARPAHPTNPDAIQIRLKGLRRCARTQ